jgi:hypothetical protein
MKKYQIGQFMKTKPILGQNKAKQSQFQSQKNPRPKSVEKNYVKYSP